MIRQLTGTIAFTEDGAVVLDVAGVGYLIKTSRIPTTTTPQETITLYTHLAVRETALDLYGFSTRDELEIFELLLTLPKIGPRSAMQIMSQADIELLKKAVLTNDATYLSKMSGIGKKTAEKIVHELSDKFADLFDMGAAIGQPASQEASDVIDALVALGYALPDARSAVQKLPEGMDTNQAIREALKQLG